MCIYIYIWDPLKAPSRNPIEPRVAWQSQALRGSHAVRAAAARTRSLRVRWRALYGQRPGITIYIYMIYTYIYIYIYTYIYAPGTAGPPPHPNGHPPPPPRGVGGVGGWLAGNSSNVNENSVITQ